MQVGVEVCSITQRSWEGVQKPEPLFIVYVLAAIEWQKSVISSPTYDF